MLDKDVQGLGVAVLGGDRQRCDPVTVPGVHPRPAPEKKIQDISTPHLT